MKKYFFLSLLIIESSYLRAYAQETTSENVKEDTSVLLNDEKKETEVSERKKEQVQPHSQKTLEEKELEWIKNRRQERKDKDAEWVKNRREEQKNSAKDIRSKFEGRSDFQYSIGDIENSTLIFELTSNPSRHDSRYLVRKLLPILKKYMEKHPKALSIVITDKSRSILDMDKALTFSSWLWSQPHAKELFLKAFLCSDEEFKTLYAQAEKTKNPEMREKLAAFYDRLEERDGSRGWVRDPINTLYMLNDQLEIAGLPLIEVNEV